MYSNLVLSGGALKAVVLLGAVKYLEEKDLIKQIDLFPSVIFGAASSHNPALVANYVYDLVKSFNSFYQSLPILKSAFDDKKSFRVELSKLVGITIKNALSILGIGVVDRM